MNTIYGGAGNDWIAGDDNNDLLYGDDGGGTSSGHPGADTLNGGKGDDKLYGEQGNDLLIGHGDNDSLYGGAGNDRLYGDNDINSPWGGNDLRDGGSGVDLMWGGLGADVFDYNHVSDSPASARDWIMDFSKAQGDKVDLSGIDAKSTNFFINDAFTFIGSNGFSGVAGQLQFEQHHPTSGPLVLDTTTLSGDTNGDAVADFAVVCLGLIDFMSSDFML